MADFARNPAVSGWLTRFIETISEFRYFFSHDSVVPTAVQKFKGSKVQGRRQAAVQWFKVQEFKVNGRQTFCFLTARERAACKFIDLRDKRLSLLALPRRKPRSSLT
jgi:hypothetical protein